MHLKRIGEREWDRVSCDTMWKTGEVQRTRQLIWVDGRGQSGRDGPSASSIPARPHTHTHKVVQLNFSSVHDDVYSLVLTHWALSYRPGSVSKRATTTFSSGTSAGDVPELVCLRCVLTKSSVKKYVYFSKAISYLHWLSIHYGHEAWYWQFNVFLIHKTFSYDQQRYIRIIFIAY